MSNPNLRKYKFQRKGKDNFVRVLHSQQGIIPTETKPERIYREGDLTIRVFSTGIADGVLPRSNKVRMPEMEV